MVVTIGDSKGQGSARWADMVEDADVEMGGEQAGNQATPENPNQGVPPEAQNPAEAGGTPMEVTTQAEAIPPRPATR